MLQCYYARVPCPTCRRCLIRRGEIEGKKAKESFQRKEERAKTKTRELEQEDSLASTKSGAIEVFDFSYSYGIDEASISKLSRFISQNLHTGCCLENLSISKLFSCIQRSYKRWKSVDTLMLAATAYASCWFTPNQDEKLQDWMQSLLEVDRLSVPQSVD